MSTRIAFTLTPLPGEPFGLWWHTYATRLRVSTVELSVDVGIPISTRPSARDFDPRGVDARHLDKITAATGLPEPTLRALFDTDRPEPSAVLLHLWTALTDPACPEPPPPRVAKLLARLRDADLDPAERARVQDELTDLSLIALHLTQPGIERLHGFTRQLPTADAFTRAGAVLDNIAPIRADRLDELIAPASGHNAAAIPFSWRPASPALHARIARLRGASISAAERLRHATTLPLLRPAPRQRRDPAQRRAARLPDQIWPAWALRLTDDDGVNNPVFRAAMSVALLLPHSRLSLGQLAAMLPTGLAATSVGHQLRRLDETPNAARAFRVLTELALALDEHEIPIDYPRRRALAATTDLIDDAALDRYCRNAGLRPGYTRRLDHARRYLYELLTGGSLAYAPRPYLLPKGMPRITYIDFCAALPANLVDALHQHTRRLLDTAGITNEPLTWQPPADWIDTAEWPGVDPDQTDPAIVHDAMRQQWADIEGHFSPTHATAATLGISLGHLRHVLRSHPVDTAPYSAHRAGTILAISSTPDGPRHQRTERPHGRQPVFHVELDWLREQLGWGRSIKHIATEIGCTRGALGKFAITHGIDIRPRSGGRNCIPVDAINCPPSQLPDLLRTALTGARSVGRIQRFLFIIDQPSLNQASVALGLSQGSLTMQLHTLERICGGQLLHRPPHPRPVGPLTDLGERLRDQARRYLVQPALDTS